MNKKQWGWMLPACVLLLCSILAAGQNTIKNLEYFVDTDPGFGKANAVSITSATVLNNIPVNVDIAGLSNGLHNLYFRSRNDNGWSQTNRWLFIKQQVNAASVNKLEYFLDNAPDPGFGNATDVPITPGTTVSNIGLPVNISGLTDGLHNVYLRSRDNNGRWSTTGRVFFF
jgi:hypothetical protein